MGLDFTWLGLEKSDPPSPGDLEKPDPNANLVSTIWGTHQLNNWMLCFNYRWVMAQQALAGVGKAQSHRGPLYECRACPVLCDKRSMVMHIVAKHLQVREAPYFCTLCDTKYVSRRDWERHRTDVHHRARCAMRPKLAKGCMGINPDGVALEGPSAFLRRRPTVTWRWLPLQKTLPWSWTRTPLVVLSLRRSQNSPHHKEVTAPTNQIEPLPTTLSLTSPTRRKSPLRPGRFRQWLRTWSLRQVHPKAPGLETHPHLPRPTVRRGRRAWRVLSPLSRPLQCPWRGRVQPPGALSQMTCPHLPRPTTLRRGKRVCRVLSPQLCPLSCPRRRPFTLMLLSPHVALPNQWPGHQMLLQSPLRHPWTQRSGPGFTHGWRKWSGLQCVRAWQQALSSSGRSWPSNTKTSRRASPTAPQKIYGKVRPDYLVSAFSRVSSHPTSKQYRKDLSKLLARVDGRRRQKYRKQREEDEDEDWYYIVSGRADLISLVDTLKQIKLD